MAIIGTQLFTAVPQLTCGPCQWALTQLHRCQASNTDQRSGNGHCVCAMLQQVHADPSTAPTINSYSTRHFLLPPASHLPPDFERSYVDTQLLMWLEGPPCTSHGITFTYQHALLLMNYIALLHDITFTFQHALLLIKSGLPQCGLCSHYFLGLKSNRSRSSPYRHNTSPARGGCGYGCIDDVIILCIPWLRSLP